MITLTRRYEFAAAHRLIGLRERHKCSRLHGHAYLVDLTVAGPLANGLIVDVGDLDVCVRPVIARLDHQYLNEMGERGGMEGVLAQPTVENIALYLCQALRFLRRDSTAGGFQLVSLRVYESDRTWADATFDAERATSGPAGGGT